MPEGRIIINPAAGRGRGAQAGEELGRLCNGKRFDMLVTTRPGDATDWGYEAAQDGVEFVAGAGGDGTANEILNGLARWVNEGGDPGRLPKFGMVPVGTGNDFAYNFALSKDLPTACDVLWNGRTRPMDVGLVESDTQEPLYFANGVGLGFDAVVAIQSSKIKFLRGGAVYLPAALATMLFYYFAPRVRVTLDNEVFEDNLMMISVMNGERFGAMFHMTPGCRIDDRQLSLCFVDRVKRHTMFALVPRFIKGTHVTDPHIRLATSGKVIIESDQKLPAHADGEIYSVTAQRYEFSIVPWQVQMLY